MEKEILEKGNQLQNNIKFLTEKSLALELACKELVSKNIEADDAKELLTKFVVKLMESFEGSMALTDIVRCVTNEYDRKIKEFQKEFKEL